MFRAILPKAPPKQSNANPRWRLHKETPNLHTNAQSAFKQLIANSQTLNIPSSTRAQTINKGAIDKKSHNSHMECPKSHATILRNQKHAWQNASAQAACAYPQNQHTTRDTNNQQNPPTHQPTGRRCAKQTHSHLLMTKKNKKH